MLIYQTQCVLSFGTVLRLLDMRLGQKDYNNKVMGIVQGTLQNVQCFVVPGLL